MIDQSEHGKQIGATEATAAFLGASVLRIGGGTSRAATPKVRGGLLSGLCRGSVADLGAAGAARLHFGGR